jgi:VCBS repeat-containing protein
MSSANSKRKSRRLFVQTLETRRLLHAEGVISGTVFVDVDGDGTRDAAEAGSPGVVLQLTSGAGSVTRSTITDDNGNYLFDELEPGTYSVIKRDMRAIANGTTNNRLELTLADDAVLGSNHFALQGVRPEFVSIGLFFASSSSESLAVREAIAMGEQLAGDVALAASIRAGAGVPSIDFNNAPTAGNDNYSIQQGNVLVVDQQSGLLNNDQDFEDDTLTATIVTQPANGTVSINSNGSFTYTPRSGFTGSDSFTYRANDSAASSNAAVVTITVTPAVDSNRIPVANNDAYPAQENVTLTIAAAAGVLANDTDADNNTLTAAIVSQPTNGTVSLASNGSFTYQPTAEFFGTDSFTYRASDATTTSNLATVTITVRPVDSGARFAAVTAGDFTAAGVLGIRTDLVAGAPAITANHVNGDVDYSNHSNPPTYGDHHGQDLQGTDVNPGITPRVTGIYTTEQPEEDLIHNLEHGHVWISYDPSLLSSADLAALQQLVRDGVGNANGQGAGVILTPRAANDTMIALASWARLQTLNRFDPDAIRNFVNTNRGKAPEGFLTP